MDTTDIRKGAETPLIIRAADLISDPQYIGSRMRLCDVLEVGDLGGLTPVRAVALSCEGSNQSLVWTAVSPVDGPVAIFGAAASLTLGVGHPWMLATDAVAKHPKELVRYGRDYTEAMQAVYPILTNVVDCRNTQSIRWLEHLGYQMIRRYHAYGYNQVPAYQFMRRSALCASC